MTFSKWIDSFFKRIKPKNQTDILKRDGDIFVGTHDLDTNPVQKGDLSSKLSTSKTVKPPQLKLGKSIKELLRLNIDLRPSKADRFTEISFKNGVLEIAPVMINDLFMAVLIICMSYEYRSKICSDLTAYACFMRNLMKHPKDVEFLSSNGFILTFSNDDETIAKSFRLLRMITSDLPIEDSYLTQTSLDIESYSNKERITSPGQHYFFWKFMDYIRFGHLQVFGFLFPHSYDHLQNDRRKSGATTSMTSTKIITMR